MVLTHARNYRSEDIRQSKKRWELDLCVVPLLSDATEGALRVWFAGDTPPFAEGTSQSTLRRVGSDAAYAASWIEPKCLYPLLEIWRDAKLICSSTAT